MARLTNRPPITEAVEDILDGYFPVLDHGFIALKDVMGSDEAIEAAARLSYQGGTRKSSETRGLLRYLKRKHHSTPLEMVELKFHVSMPIFVARQWIRTRTASVNEVSGRYSLLPMLFYTPEREHFKLQSSANKQGRGTEASGTVYDHSNARMQTIRAQAQAAYEYMAAHDVARELARIDLPLSTYTQWVWKIDLHNLFRFLTQRVDQHAQYEIRAYANIIAGMVQRVAPLAYEAWIDYDVAGCSMSRMEMEVLRSLLHASKVRQGSAADGEETDKRDVYVRSQWDQLSGWSGTAMQKQFGLSSREVEELYEKLRPQGVPDFTLDLWDMQPGSAFEEKMRAATPKVDRA